MMQLQAGMYLKSTEALNNTIFAGTILFITEYNAAGAVGFVINRPFGRSLHELDEFSQSPYFPLYDGGPVDKEHLFFLHRRPDLIDGGIAVANDTYYGGDFRQVINALDKKILLGKDVKIFVGYCGWDTGELEAEIKEGSWTLTADGTENIFR